MDITNSVISKNSANESLIYIASNSHLKVRNTSFLENFSFGRGSLIFSERINSVVLISESIFKNNYALTGGVFFAQLNGYIEASSSVFDDNFALSGGILYS